MASLNSLNAAAFRKLGIGTRDHPTDIFPKFAKTDFEDLKADYNKQFGYTIRIPQWDDIVHLVPTALKSDATIKAEKKEGLVRVLDSPAPEWARTYSSVMTWIDNIQDTASVVIPLVSFVARAVPKIADKLLGVFGWVLLGYDILNFANAIGRAPLTGMKSKREVCKFVRGNPFGKYANFERMGRIRNYKPGMGDLLQALQVADQFTGAGLSLGGIMGAITDSIFGAYRYATGEPVRFSFDPPEVSNLSMMGARGLQAAAAISSQGQTFNEMTHFWTYITGALSTVALAGEFRDQGLSDLIEDPMSVMIPAPEPKDPYTIAAIADAGLKVEDGIGWPYNGQKFISIGDFIDATAEPCKSNFMAYSMRHEKDWYGLAAAMAVDYMIPHVVLSIEPEGTYNVDDTDLMKVFWIMIKAPVLPTQPVTEEQGNAFIKWVEDFNALYGKKPGLLEIEQKFDSLGIPYTNSYPSEEGPDFEKFFLPGYRGDESF